MSAITTSLEHVFSVLKNSPASALVDGRMYQGFTPANEEFPLVLVQTYGDTSDLLGVGRTQAVTTELLVRVIDNSPTLATAEVIADACAEALHQSFGGNSRGWVSSCVRLSESELVEKTDLGVIRYLDTKYRLLINEVSVVSPTGTIKQA